ncbi:MAG: DUF1015 domain-containing protein [Clostridia bacterium]|nr:DUF1015 domain-containing protein [Clostridia bacterium]
MSERLSFTCLKPSEILLPGPSVPPETWAVIACDQYTSRPDYWERVAKQVGNKPSALHMILPEAFLGRKDARAKAEKIPQYMWKVLKEGILRGPAEEHLPAGFVLTERTTLSGVRTGLVAALDLEAYDYEKDTLPVRATEKTVPERVPPRVKIRSEAVLELPHILLLADDPGRTLLEPLRERLLSRREKPEYDFELMENGGHLRGWRVWTEEDMRFLSSSLAMLEKKSDGFLFAVGDGNHSLAAAKKCWTERKKNGADPDADPYRYALVEIVNLHSDAIVFRPIHRLLKGIRASELRSRFQSYLSENGIRTKDGSDIRFVENGEILSGCSLDCGLLPVQAVQPFLDELMKENPDVSVDYIHGDGELLSLTKNTISGNEHTSGILLESVRKEDLFPGIRAGGPLPRKAFSMGEADEKRFYFESRKLV